MKTKTKIEKHKKEKKNPHYSFCLPHTYFKKQMSLMDLFWVGNEKIC